MTRYTITFPWRNGQHYYEIHDGYAGPMVGFSESGTVLERGCGKVWSHVSGLSSHALGLSDWFHELETENNIIMVLQM